MNNLEWLKSIVHLEQYALNKDFDTHIERAKVSIHPEYILLVSHDGERMFKLKSVRAKELSHQIENLQKELTKLTRGKVIDIVANELPWLTKSSGVLSHHGMIVVGPSNRINYTNWHAGTLEGHETFGFDGVDDSIKLTHDNVDEFITVLKDWYNKPMEYKIVSQDLLSMFEGLKEDETGLKDSNGHYWMQNDMDVNMLHDEPHDVFKFDGDSDVYLTQGMYEEFKSVLRNRFDLPF